MLGLHKYTQRSDEGQDVGGRIASTLHQNALTLHQACVAQTSLLSWWTEQLHPMHIIHKLYVTDFHTVSVEICNFQYP